MGHQNRHARKLVAAATATLVTLGASKTDAGLMVDLRAVGISSGFIEPGGKQFMIDDGAVVTIGIFAQVSGTNGHTADASREESLNSLWGLINSVGSRKGNLYGTSGTVFLHDPGDTTAPDFSDLSSQNGSNVDWDSDGDLDIGLSPTSSSASGKFFARNGTGFGITGSAINANTSEFLVGKVIFEPTGGSGGVNINFTVRNNNGSPVMPAALWWEDGSTVAVNPSTGSYTAGSPVTLEIPEPATLRLLALPSLGLLARRRCRTRSK